jgi:hypothetical protein
MKQIYNSDKPINLKEQDRFNRYRFSSRIADTIIKRDTKEGLVIGLYGIWGEGKSSVLNMIEKDLSENNEVLIVKFNPWRFKDEDALILNFFKNISIVLDKELNTKTEKLGRFLSKYGSITSVVNLNLSEIGKSLSDFDIEKLKERVNDFLENSNKKVIVIIDDIDRLDKQELFALFKLIKLTGDFANTYYILSFDDEMVASSIGERYADGNKISGYNFLEKIIQVPLIIPQALSKDLLNYTFELLNGVLKINEIDLQEEASTVGYQISQNLLSRIKTPRLAIRFANSLSFLIPLLKGEVNMSDLILFEGIKLFCPQYYNFIKRSPEFFIESYKERFSESLDTKKKEELKSKIDSLNENLSTGEKKSILDLLKHLFPYVNDGLENHSYSSLDTTKWSKEKRIASSKYFNRYFLYSVPNNDISDVYFKEYIDKIGKIDFDEILKETKEMLRTAEPIEFLSRVEFRQDELSWEQRKTLIHIICKYKFEDTKGEDLIIFHNPKSKAAITIANLLAKHNNEKEYLAFTKKVIQENKDYDFSFELIRWFRVVKNREYENVFNSDDIQNLGEILLESVLKDCEEANSNIFQRHSNYIFRLLEFWYKKSPLQLKRYINKCIKEYKDFHEVIIEELTTKIYSSSDPEPYKTDFKKEAYDVLKKYYDVEKLYKMFLNKKYAKIRVQEVKFFEPDKGHTKETSIRQFLHWHEQDKKVNNESFIEKDEVTK